MRPIFQVAHLISVLKKVTGRKKMQKIVHILQELEHPFTEKFEYSYYGMYSSQLRAELDQLESEHLITESASATELGETTYVVQTTDELDSFLNKSGVDKRPEWAAVAHDLNLLNPRQLEAISTILFLRNRGFKGERLKERFVALKPHLKTLFANSERKAGELLETSRY